MQPVGDGAVRILWLGNSDDLGDYLPLEARAQVIAARLLERELERPVEVILRAIWPAPELPRIIDGWMERYGPQLVMFKVNAYWYLYRSVPLQIERKLPWMGRYLGSAGAAAGRRRWLSERRLFHAGRGLLLRTIGGASHFTVPEVVETVEVVTRQILQRESAGLVIHPSLDRWASNPHRQKTAHDAISAFAASVHAAYLGADPFDPAAAPPKDFYAGRDRLHSDEEASAWLGARQATALLQAWQQAHGV